MIARTMPTYHTLSSSRNGQRGGALLVMLVILVIGITTAFVTSLSSTAINNKRNQTTAEALAQAKEALIGYAVSDPNRPGELPCPDTGNDGSAESNCSAAGSSLVGRLPWRTLGLPDIRDSAMEHLWYVVSDSFHANGSTPINSETTGTISLSGNVTANNLIAIVFAPGKPLSAQVRSTENENNSMHYLESVVNSPTSFKKLTPNDQAGGASTYNDHLITISGSDLWPSVEKVVGKRFRQLPLLNTYYTVWGAFPFAAPFVDPSLPFTDASKPFIGAANTYSGLLPMGAVWTGVPGYALAGGSAGVTCTLNSGYNGLADARAYCDIVYITDTPTISITGTLKGLRLWRLHDLSDVNQVRVKVSGNNFSASEVAGMNATISALKADGSSGLNADGSVTVTFTGTLVPGVERIRLRDVVVDPSVDPVDPAYAWFTRNQWNRVMYYAISPGYAPAGGNSCTPLPGGTPPSCLTVNGSAGGDDKRAVITMTGGALNGQSRAASPIALCPTTGTTIAPNACPSNYLESENATPADFIYENKTRSGTFNDQVIIVAP